MQIQSLSLSDFGGWKNLSLGNLSGSLNVLHGPNEVGKTTLLRFLREMLYGQKLAREDELLAFPLSQGRCVGICDVETPTGRYRLERSFCLPGKFGERAVDHVVVEGLQADGSEQQASSQGIAALQVLLSGVDADVYRNVFAFGIDEVERLATCWCWWGQKRSIDGPDVGEHRPLQHPSVRTWVQAPVDAHRLL